MRYQTLLSLGKQLGRGLYELEVGFSNLLLAHSQREAGRCPKSDPEKCAMKDRTQGPEDQRMTQKHLERTAELGAPSTAASHDSTGWLTSREMPFLTLGRNDKGRRQGEQLQHQRIPTGSGTAGSFMVFLFIDKKILIAIKKQQQQQQTFATHQSPISFSHLFPIESFI